MGKNSDMYSIRKDTTCEKRYRLTPAFWEYLFWWEMCGYDFFPSSFLIAPFSIKVESTGKTDTRLLGAFQSQCLSCSSSAKKEVSPTWLVFVFIFPIGELEKKLFNAGRIWWDKPHLLFYGKCADIAWERRLFSIIFHSFLIAPLFITAESTGKNDPRLLCTFQSQTHHRLKGSQSHLTWAQETHYFSVLSLLFPVIHVGCSLFGQE